MYVDVVLSAGGDGGGDVGQWRARAQGREERGGGQHTLLTCRRCVIGIHCAMEGGRWGGMLQGGVLQEAVLQGGVPQGGGLMGIAGPDLPFPCPASEAASAAASGVASGVASCPEDPAPQ